MNTITIMSGDTWKRAWILKSNNAPIDLTGASARLHVRNQESDELVVSASTETKELTITPEDGRIDLRVDGSDMCLDHTKL